MKIAVSNLQGAADFKSPLVLINIIRHVGAYGFSCHTKTGQACRPTSEGARLMVPSKFLRDEKFLSHYALILVFYTQILNDHEFELR